MTAMLQQVSDALAATVEAASAGVVRVEARHRLSATGIVWSSDGVIVTAHHVVEQGRLLLGDTLVSLEGRPISQHDDLLALMGPERIGTIVSIQILRNGKVQEQRAVIGERA